MTTTKGKGKAKVTTKRSAGKTTSSAVASKAARILSTSTDPNERAVAASALAQVEPDDVGAAPLIVPEAGGLADLSGIKDMRRVSQFSLNDFIADVLANVGTSASISYECYTAENVVDVLSWLNYNGGYVYGSDGTRVEVRKRAQQ